MAEYKNGRRVPLLTNITKQLSEDNWNDAEPAACMVIYPAGPPDESGDGTRRK